MLHSDHTSLQFPLERGLDPAVSPRGRAVRVGPSGIDGPGDRARGHPAATLRNGRSLSPHQREWPRSSSSEGRLDDLALFAVRSDVVLDQGPSKDRPHGDRPALVTRDAEDGRAIGAGRGGKWQARVGCWLYSRRPARVVAATSFCRPGFSSAPVLSPRASHIRGEKRSGRRRKGRKEIGAEKGRKGERRNHSGFTSTQDQKGFRPVLPPRMGAWDSGRKGGRARRRGPRPSGRTSSLSVHSGGGEELSRSTCAFPTDRDDILLAVTQTPEARPQLVADLRGFEAMGCAEDLDERLLFQEHAARPHRLALGAPAALLLLSLESLRATLSAPRVLLSPSSSSTSSGEQEDLAEAPRRGVDAEPKDLLETLPRFFGIPTSKQSSSLRAARQAEGLGHVLDAPPTP